MGPHVVPIGNAVVFDGGFDVEEDNVAVNLEQVSECAGRNAYQVVHGLTLGEEGAVLREQVAGLGAQVPFPVVFVHDDDHFTGLAAHVGQQGLAGLAASKGEDGQDYEGKKLFHIALFE